jgi:hypothetical protein
MTEKSYQLADIDERRSGPSAAAYAIVAILSSVLTILLVAPVSGLAAFILAPFAGSLAALVVATGLASNRRACLSSRVVTIQA